MIYFPQISAHKVIDMQCFTINIPATFRSMLATLLKLLSLKEHWYVPLSETRILWSLSITLPSPIASFTNSVRSTYSEAAFPFTSWPSLYRWTSLLVEWSPLNQDTSICFALCGGDNWQLSSVCPPTTATKCPLGMVTVHFSVEKDRKL